MAHIHIAHTIENIIFKQNFSANINPNQAIYLLVSQRSNSLVQTTHSVVYGHVFVGLIVHLLHWVKVDGGVGQTGRIQRHQR